MENKKEIEKDEHEIKFEQLIMKINIGKYPLLAYIGKILFLSKGILIIHNKEMFLYDYIKYSRHFLMTMPKEFEDNIFIKLGQLRNNKFYMCTKNETFIYQFNDDFTIKLLKKINENLYSLQEIEDNIYINSIDEYMYIWKELKPIFKEDQLIFDIINTIFVFFLFIFLLLLNFNDVLACVIIFLEYTTFIVQHHKFVHFLNPYKRFKIFRNSIIEKCGKYLCFETASGAKALFDYKNFTIKNIKPNDEGQNIAFWYNFEINDNIIIFSSYPDKRYKIYDVLQDKIIKDYKNDFKVSHYKTSKVGNNLYYSFRDEYLYKWKYNFKLNKVDILNKKDIKYLGKSRIYETINDKLYFITEKRDNNYSYSDVTINIYQ